MKYSLPLPPSINATYKTGKGRFYKSNEARNWEELAGWHLKKYPKIRFEVPIYVGLEFFFKRERDIDSGIKITLDLLQKYGIIKNDLLVKHLNVKTYKDKKNPHMEIQVEILES